MASELEQLEKRLERLERSSRGSLAFFVQYLLSPILVVVIGLVFNFQLEQDRKAVQQVKIAQSMLETLFSGDEFKSLATQRLLNEVLENERLKKELGLIIRDYFDNRFAESMKKGDMESASRIYQAARVVGGDVSQQLLTRIESEPQNTRMLSRYEQALGFEQAGFDALVAGDFDTALQQFAEAKAVYPDFHSVAEIHALLKANRRKFHDPEVQKKIVRKIVSQYAWKAPAQAIAALAQQYR